MSTFEKSWEQKKAEGYQYGDEALEQVRFGWELAMASVKEDVEKIITALEFLHHTQYSDQQLALRADTLRRFAEVFLSK